MSNASKINHGAGYGYPSPYGGQLNDINNIDPRLFPSEGFNSRVSGNDSFAEHADQAAQNQAELEACLMSSEHGVDIPNLHFATYEDYSRQLEQQKRDEWNRAIANGGVDDSPQMAPAIQTYIRRIISAFKNTDNIIDKNGKKRNLAQAAQRIMEGYYSDIEIEKIAWEIYDTARNAQVGIRVAGPHNGPKAERHESFHKRMDAIIHGLLKSKAECKQVLDPLYLNRLCENPTGEFLMKINNGKINGQRDVQNELGRNALNDKLNIRDVASYKEKAKKCREDFIEKTKAMAQMDSAGSLDSAPVRGNRRAAGTISSTTVLTGAGAKRKRGSQDEQKGSFQEQSQPFIPEERPAWRPRVGAPLSNNHAGMQPHWRNFIPGGIKAVQQMVGVPHAKGNFESPHRHGSSSTSSSSVSDRDPRDPSRREILCDLLQISRSNALRYSLPDLQLYARAYNRRLSHAPWFPPDLPECTGWGYRLEKEGVIIAEHLALAIPRLRDMAMERRDLLHTGLLNPVASGIHGFDTEGHEVKDDALGVRTEGGLSYDTIFHKASAHSSSPDSASSIAHPGHLFLR